MMFFSAISDTRSILRSSASPHLLIHALAGGFDHSRPRDNGLRFARHDSHLPKVEERHEVRPPPRRRDAHRIHELREACGTCVKNTI